MTDNVNPDGADMELLSRVLETYGSDRNRWPAAERLALSRVLADSATARRMLRETELFDALLDKAPVVASAREAALAARIVAAAAGMPQSVQATAKSTVRHVAPAPTIMVGPQVARQPAVSSHQMKNGWIGGAALARSARVASAATLLAAALLVGIFTGSATNLYGPDIAAPASGIETADATEAIDYSDYVLDDVTYDALDEEFL